MEEEKKKNLWWCHFQVSKIYKRVLDTIPVQKFAFTYMLPLKEVWFCLIVHLWFFLVKDESLNWHFRDNSIKEDDYLEKKRGLWREKLLKHLCIVSVQNITGKIPFTGQDSIQHDKQ